MRLIMNNALADSTQSLPQALQTPRCIVFKTLIYTGKNSSSLCLPADTYHTVLLGRGLTYCVRGPKVRLEKHD